MHKLEPELELRLQQQIKRRLDPLVCQATRTTGLLNGSGMEESQLRNVLNVASESRSLEVVTNFIRYQIARNQRAWGISLDGFGHTVIKDLYGPVTKLAKQAVEDTVSSKNVTDDQQKLLHEKALIELMQLYLGYLNRAFYFAKKTGDYAVLSEVAKRCEQHQKLQTDGKERPQ